MYLADFFKHLIRKSNFPVIIYLVLNVFLISSILGSLFTPNVFGALGIGMLIYLLSLIVALSPIGEAILRYQTGCKKITDTKVLNQMEPIFREVYKKAKIMNPNIPDDVSLYMNESNDVNAFATGRKTVCITKGLLYESPELIKATLGHEMGHLAHHDTDLILIVTVGNLIASAIFVLIRLGARIMSLFGTVFAAGSGDEGGFIAGIFIHISSIIADVFLVCMMNLWTKLGTALVMKSSRGNEFEADEFSFNLGYGYALCRLLDTFPPNEDKGLFANLMASHPDKNDRINRLRQLGVKY